MNWTERITKISRAYLSHETSSLFNVHQRWRPWVYTIVWMIRTHEQLKAFLALHATNAIAFKLLAINCWRYIKLNPRDLLKTYWKWTFFFICEIIWYFCMVWWKFRQSLEAWNIFSFQSGNGHMNNSRMLRRYNFLFLHFSREFCFFLVFFFDFFQVFTSLWTFVQYADADIFI